MFDHDTLATTITRHGPTARIVIAAHQGSSPREVGASMLVWATGQSGTIGGGALEHEATLRARQMLPTGGTRLDRTALGPALGQCCGGTVTLLTEVYTATPEGEIIARATDNSEMPLAVKRLFTKARNEGLLPQSQLLHGWMVEPSQHPTRHLWIWGAGHVGRALVHTLAPLPGVHITWIDTAPDRFPTAPANIHILPTPDPALAVPLAPQTAEHLILTYSHALDLELCHRLLTHGFRSAGLIGSATKWARFQSRLTALGHTPTSIARIQCPIGDPSLGKHPQAIAISVALEFLAKTTVNASRQENAG